ncbi:MAG: hypothetical protein HQL69_24545, partial [Magnetococcales bacterium]|nr:hypothetical protein [Magnetococcales bacterium]
EKPLREIENALNDHFSHIVFILKEYQADEARKIIHIHRKQTRRTCDRLIEDIVAGRVEGISATESAALALKLRYLKRISAHLKNIATSVVNPFDRIGFKEKKQGRQKKPEPSKNTKL